VGEGGGWWVGDGSGCVVGVACGFSGISFLKDPGSQTGGELSMKRRLLPRVKGLEAHTGLGDRQTIHSKLPGNSWRANGRL